MNTFVISPSKLLPSNIRNGSCFVSKLYILTVLMLTLSSVSSGTRRPISNNQTECVCSNVTDCATRTCDYVLSDAQDIDIIYSDIQKWKQLVVQNARNVELHRTAIAENIEINNVTRVTIVYRYNVPDSKAFKTLNMTNCSVVGNGNISFNTLDVLHLSNSKVGAIEQNQKAFKEIDIIDESVVETMSVSIATRRSTFQDSTISKIERLQIEDTAILYMDSVEIVDILSLTYASISPAIITHSSVDRIGANSIVVQSTATSSSLEFSNMQIGELSKNSIRVEGILNFKDSVIFFSPNDGIVIEGEGKIFLDNVTINGRVFSVSLGGVTGNGSVNLLDMWTSSNSVNDMIYGLIIAFLLVVIIGLIIWRVLECFGKCKVGETNLIISKGKQDSDNIVSKGKQDSDNIVSKGKQDSERSMSSNLYERKETTLEIPLTRKNPMPSPDSDSVDFHDPPPPSINLNQVSTEPDDSSFADLPPPPPPPIEEEMPTYEDVEPVKTENSFLHNKSLLEAIQKKNETKSGNISDRIVQKPVVIPPKPITLKPSPISHPSGAPKAAAAPSVPAYPPLSSIPNSALYYKSGSNKPAPPPRNSSAAASPPVALTPGYSGPPLYHNPEVDDEEEEGIYESEQYNPV